jgi:hypothetical protein
MKKYIDLRKDRFHKHLKEFSPIIEALEDQYMSSTILSEGSQLFAVTIPTPLTDTLRIFLSDYAYLSEVPLVITSSPTHFTLTIKETAIKEEEAT